MERRINTAQGYNNSCQHRICIAKICQPKHFFQQNYKQHKQKAQTFWGTPQLLLVLELGMNVKYQLQTKGKGLTIRQRLHHHLLLAVVFPFRSVFVSQANPEGINSLCEFRI